MWACLGSPYSKEGWSFRSDSLMARPHASASPEPWPSMLVSRRCCAIYKGHKAAFKEVYEFLFGPQTIEPYLQNWRGADESEFPVMKFIASTHMHTRALFSLLVMRIKSTGNEVGSGQTLKKQLAAVLLRDFIDSSLKHFSLPGLIVGWTGLILSTAKIKN